MKNNKLLKILLLILTIFCIGKSNIYAAFPESISGIQQAGVKVGDDWAGARLALKYYGNTAVYCTTYSKTTPALSTDPDYNDGVIQYSKINWEPRVAAGVASIINSAGSITIFNSENKEVNASKEYYYGELAINEFLNTVGSCYFSGTCDIYASKDPSQTLGSTYDDWYDRAMNVYNNYSAGSASLSATNLTFTRNGDKYVSNEISVTKNEAYGVVKYSISSSRGQVVENGNSFHIEIAANEITTKTDVSVTISPTKYIEIAQGYKPSNDKYQAITPAITETTSFALTSSSISGTITPLGKLTINKVDGDNKPLSGAKIKVTGTKGYNKEFVTNGQPIVIEDLEYGTYTIEEIEAPTGYIKAEKQTVNLSSTNYTANITLTDKIVTTVFSKLDATGKKELPGAFLEIQDLDGKIVKFCPGTEEEEYSECSWISTNEPYVIKGLPVGKYYLVETLAPEGYVLNKEKVLFQITGNEETVNVKMKNSLNKVKISKISATNKKELPGATLEIQDKYGKVVKYCTNEKGKKNQPCIWTSTDKPYEIEGMPNGKYYLIETLAPEGYVLNKEKVEFIVDGKKAVVEVEMKNELEVKVPDTLSARSTLLIAISMFDIALGIGILTYVKKSKA